MGANMAQEVWNGEAIVYAGHKFEFWASFEPAATAANGTAQPVSVQTSCKNRRSCITSSRGPTSCMRVRYAPADVR